LSKYNIRIGIRSILNLLDKVTESTNQDSPWEHLLTGIYSKRCRVAPLAILTKQDITDLLQSQQRLVDIEKRVEIYDERIRRQQLQKIQLENEINRIKAYR
jgi:hypothetical protein